MRATGPARLRSVRVAPGWAAGALLVTIASAVAACRSSAPYAGPAYVGAVTGAAVAGAAANAALGGCLAECIAGTYCNPATGLCQREGPPAVPGAAPLAPSPGGRPPPRVSSVSYPPGHEYDVPASMSVADAGCEPGHDAGSLACEMDAAASSE